MGYLRAVLLVLVGGVLGAVLTNGARVREVRAQDRFTSIGGCTSVVPKSWGDFKGASTYGLAFVDGDGNVRFLEHPTCGTLGSPLTNPPASVDLLIQRR